MARSSILILFIIFIRYHVRNGSISVTYIPTAEMLAYGLTKMLPTFKHNFCKRSMGIRSSLELALDTSTSTIPSVKIRESFEAEADDVYIAVAVLFATSTIPWIRKSFLFYFPTTSYSKVFYS